MNLKTLRITTLALAAIAASTTQTRAEPPSAGGQAVALTAQVQAASGVESQPLAVTSYEPQARAYGVVVDVKPLIDLSSRVSAAQGQARALAAAVGASRQEYDRARLLNQHDRNVSDKQVQAARAAWEADQARFQAAQAELAALAASARAEWGEVLSRWALEGAPQFQALSSGKEALLQIVLPPQLRLGAAPSTIRVKPGAGAAGERPARLISPSPRADPTFQGETFFYRLPRGGLRTGLRVVAYLPLAGKPLRGVVIPDSAVVWYANRPWVYVQTDREHFVRRPISTDHPVSGGWFVAQGWQAGERVVVRGGELLFAMEFRPVGVKRGGGGDED